MKLHLLGAVCASIFTITVTSTAYSATIAVNNFDFELPELVDGAINEGPVPGWITTGSGRSGTFNPSGNLWYLTTDDQDTAASGGVFGTMDGPRVGFFFQSSTRAMSQELPELLSVGEIYRLTVAIGQRDGNPTANGPFAGYVIELLSGADVVASISSDTAPGGPGTFDDVSLVYTATASDSIGPLGIRIGVKNSGHLDFDNVRLNTIPLPASVWLFGSGLLGLVGIARRKKAV
jgi:hypothetical protein